MTKVDLEIIRPWINTAVTSYLGYEDDVVVEFTCSQLEQVNGIDDSFHCVYLNCIQVVLTRFTWKMLCVQK